MPRLPRRALWRCVCVGNGEEVVIPLGALDPVECDGCGLDYDPRTGEPLPVCEGLPPIPAAAATRSHASPADVHRNGFRIVHGPALGSES